MHLAIYPLVITSSHCLAN